MRPNEVHRPTLDQVLRRAKAISDDKAAKKIRRMARKVKPIAADITRERDRRLGERDDS